MVPTPTAYSAIYPWRLRVCSFYFVCFFFPSTFFYLTTFLGAPNRDGARRAFIIPFIGGHLRAKELGVCFLVVNIRCVLNGRNGNTSIARRLLLSTSVRFRHQVCYNLSMNRSSVVVYQGFNQPCKDRDGLIRTTRCQNGRAIFRFLPLLHPAVVVVGASDNRVRLPGEGE